jgi:hypothetical protein
MYRSSKLHGLRDTGLLAQLLMTSALLAGCDIGESEDAASGAPEAPLEATEAREVQEEVGDETDERVVDVHSLPPAGDGVYAPDRCASVGYVSNVRGRSCWVELGQEQPVDYAQVKYLDFLGQWRYALCRRAAAYGSSWTTHATSTTPFCKLTRKDDRKNPWKP